MSAVPKACVFGAAMLVSVSCLAKSTGVGDDPALQTGPCYQALVDKNAANPTTAPNRELGSACDAEHGDVEKAWADWANSSPSRRLFVYYQDSTVPISQALAKRRLPNVQVQRSPAENHNHVPITHWQTRLTGASI